MEHCNFKFKSLKYCLEHPEHKDKIEEKLLKTVDCDYFLNLKNERINKSASADLQVDHAKLLNKLNHYLR